MQRVHISWHFPQFPCISLRRRLLKSMSHHFLEHAERLILAERVFNFDALAYAGDCSKVWVILSQSMQEGWYWLRRSSISMHELMPETAQKYKLSFLRACRKVDICWDALQFQCTSLCQRLLKSMSYPSSEHAERLILAETVLNFYALAYAGDCSNVWLILSQSMQKGWYYLDGLQLLCISLCRRLLKSMSYPFWEHTEMLILSKTVFNFYALAYAADCSKVWVIFSQSTQKGWY